MNENVKDLLIGLAIAAVAMFIQAKLGLQIV
jgi:hypothetical protein